MTFPSVLDVMNLQKVPILVTPAKAGVHNYMIKQDSAEGCAVRLEKRHFVPGLAVIPDPDPGRDGI
jgi:hypothetical protein